MADFIALVRPEPVFARSAIGLRLCFIRKARRLDCVEKLSIGVER